MKRFRIKLQLRVKMYQNKISGNNVALLFCILDDKIPMVVIKCTSNISTFCHVASINFSVFLWGLMSYVTRDLVVAASCYEEGFLLQRWNPWRSGGSSSSWTMTCWKMMTTVFIHCGLVASFNRSFKVILGVYF